MAKNVTKKRSAGKIVGIVVLVLVVLVAVALVAGSIFLFHFALDPNSSYSMGKMLAGGNVAAVKPAAPAEEPSEEVLLWRAYMNESGEWFRENKEYAELVREDGSVRRGNIFPNEGHTYAVVCHGYGGDAESQMTHYVRMFWDMGMTVLAPDALAHGASDGKYYGMGWPERKDIKAWVEDLVEKDPEAEIMLFGVSMGGATVMMTSGEELPDNVKCIVEDCGYSSVWDEFAVQCRDMFHLPTFPMLNIFDLVCRAYTGYSLKEASSVNQLKKATVPMLFIHGEKDVFVPHSMLDVVYDACGSAIKEKVTIPNASHGASSYVDPVTYWSTIEAFVSRFLTVVE